MEFDLEKQYSPSLFTKRFQKATKPNEAVVNNFINVSTEEEILNFIEKTIYSAVLLQIATTFAQQKYKTRLNVRYGVEYDNQLLDIYYKDQEEGTPIFVYIHGGFWQMLDKSTSGPLVHSLIDYNCRIILVDYNLCPQVTLEQITEQICNFYKWLKNYAAATKASKISICGHSAGAHLALQMFKDEFLRPLRQLDLIDQLFLISGLYDLRELWSLQASNPQNILKLNAKKARDLSPICWQYNEDLLTKYRQQGVIFHVLVAENDSNIFKKQSEDLFKLFKALGLNVTLKEFENYDHFDIIEECSNCNSAISKYIVRSLKLIE